MRKLRMVQAINEAIEEEMRRNDHVLLYGESVQGGLLGVTGGLVEKFGEDRVLDMPICENSMNGMAIGLSLTGYRPIVEHSVAAFMFGGFEESFIAAPQWRLTHGGKVSLPLVWLTHHGARGGTGADHSLHPTSMAMQRPGMKVAVPSTPYDAKGLMKAAIRDDNPVLFMKHFRLAGLRGPVPEDDYVIPFGVADVKRQGSDVTIISSSFSTTMALAVAAQLQGEVDVEVVDLRTLTPLDEGTILESVEKTGRAVIIDEDILRCGVGAEISSIIVEESFGSLHAPVRRLGRQNVPLPAGVTMEEHVLPSEQQLLSAVRSVMQY